MLLITVVGPVFGALFVFVCTPAWRPPPLQSGTQPFSDSSFFAQKQSVSGLFGRARRSVPHGESKLVRRQPDPKQRLCVTESPYHRSECGHSRWNRFPAEIRQREGDRSQPHRTEVILRRDPLCLHRLRGRPEFLQPPIGPPEQPYATAYTLCCRQSLDRHLGRATLQPFSSFR